MVSARLADFVANLGFDDLPAAAVRNARLSILDAVGVSLAASGLEPACRPFVDLATAGGPPDCVVFGTGLRASAAGAAFANGAMAHALDFEDIHDASGMHPNAPLVPAVLALAEAEGLSGREVITAVAAGSEVCCRLALAARRPGQGSPQGFFEPTVMASFGATAGAARALRLSSQQVLDAWSLTLCQTSMSEAYRYNPLSHLRAVRDAFPAQTAVTSAQLARAGVAGFAEPFEGPAGFFSLYGYETWDEAALVDGLGGTFALEAISYKAWPACRGTHLYIQAAMDLRDAGLDIGAIEFVEAAVRPYDQKLCEPAASKRAPETAIDAKFSIPFATAAAFVTGRVNLTSFDASALADPAVVGLARRVSYRIDADAARARDEGGGDLLTVRLRDGRTITGGVERLRGGPDVPFSESEMQAKFVDCGGRAARPRSEAVLQDIAAQILTLESLKTCGR